MSGESRSFDRAAPFYDRTRTLPADAMERLVVTLAAALAERGRCLEVGVGTGRVALPLRDAGVPMAGVDLSLPMMAVLVEKGGHRPPFPLARADATALPFPDGCFGAGLASHVFHLIPDWRGAVAELVRVVRPGGVVLCATPEQDHEPAFAVQRRFRLETGVERRHVGAGHDDVAAALLERGAGERLLDPVPIHRTVRVGGLVDDLEAGCWSWTWSLPDDVVRGAGSRTRAWAEAEIGPLDASHDVESRVQWRAYDLPERAT